MFQIKDLLEKFKSIQDPEKARQNICNILNKELKMEYLTPDMVGVKKHILWLKVNPAIAQKIFMQKALCLEALKRDLPEEVIVDIR